MSLPHALLTALTEHPGSGSDLAGRFDRSIGYFWQATHQQIYRELARLEAAGWIEGLLVEYYDPMYAFQRDSKDKRIEFCGDQAAVVEYLRQRQPA